MAPPSARTRAPAAVTDARSQGPWAGVAEGYTAGLGVLAGFLTWAGIGWLVDGWLGTAPWSFVAGAVLGIVAGAYLTIVRFGPAADEREPR